MLYLYNVLVCPVSVLACYYFEYSGLSIHPGFTKWACVLETCKGMKYKLCGLMIRLLLVSMLLAEMDIKY